MKIKPKKVSEFLSDIIPLLQKDIEVKGLSLDSRIVKPGDLFFACQGTQVDGRRFIEDAIAKGASLVLAESYGTTVVDSPVPVVHVPNLSQKLGVIASRFFDEPSKKLQVVGVTGTNGKTSTSHFVASALTQLGRSCGVIGTLGSGLYGQIVPSGLTTPDAITLQKSFMDFLEQGAQYAAMEVSSHSIDQGRSNGIDFAVSIFTNLTRDHLDYHRTMENYGNTKKKLFASPNTKFSVINSDDPFGKKIIDDLHPGRDMVAYGTQKQPLPVNVEMVYADNIHLDLTGMRASIYSPWGNGELYANLLGNFNVSNLLAVFTTLCLLGIDFETVLSLIAKFKPVAGRMQMLGGGAKPLVVVDYAHTPDALEKVLNALRYHCTGKLYCVFGCGGDRDKGKRPEMAKIAEQFSDVVILTDDNPRTEDPAAIFQDVMTGFVHPEKIITQHGRDKAIAAAVRAAQPGDCVLIAGKGAETYQIIGKEQLPFSDVEQVQLAFN